MQLNVAVPETALPSFRLAGRVAVIVTGPAVALMHVAVPKVLSGLLLIETSVGSDTDQVTLLRFDAAALQPPGMPELKARNASEFPGDAAL